MKFLTAIITVSVLLAGCGDTNASNSQSGKNDNAQEENQKLSFEDKQELVSKFLNEDTKAVLELQFQAFESLNTVTEDSDDAKIKGEITKRTIPYLEESLKVMESINPGIRELEKLRDNLTESTNTYIEGLELRVQAIKDNDDQLKKQSEKLFTEFSGQFKEYNSSVDQLAEEYEIEYEPMTLLSEKEASEYQENQQYILTYINEKAGRIAVYENKAVQYMDSVTGENYTDDQTVYETLINMVIPTYEKAVAEAKNITPEINELQKAQDLLVQATETYLKGFQLHAKAIEEQDKGTLNKSEMSVSEYFRLLEQYHAELKKVANSYEIDYEPSS